MKIVRPSLHFLCVRHGKFTVIVSAYKPSHFVRVVGQQVDMSQRFSVNCGF